MKIGFVLDDTLDSSDGVQQHVLIVGDWLTKNGHEVHYIVGQTHRADIENIHSLTKNWKVKFNKNRMSIPLPANKKTIKKLLDELKLDVIHVQMPYSPQMASRVINAAEASTAVVATFHILPFSSKEKFATKLLAKTVRKSVKRIDQVIAVSAPAADFATKSFGVKCIVIPNPVVIPPKALRKKTDKIVRLVYLGRLVKRKGIMELLSAYSLLSKSQLQYPIQLKIAGTGHLEKQIDQYISTHNLSDSVERLGFVKEMDKSNLLAQADIAVFPSVAGESFGIVLTEAMASGAGLVIGGDNPGYRSVLVDDNCMFDPKDTGRFADKLKVLIESPSLRQKIHKQQQLQVKQFDIEVVGPKIASVYQSVIAKNKQ